MQLTIDSIVEHRGRWMRNNFDNLEKWRNFLASSFKWWLPRDIHNLSIYKETNAIYSFYSISDCQLFLKLRVVNVYREREQIIVIAMRNDFIMSSLKFFFFSLETTIFFRRKLTCEDLQSFVWKISMKFSLSLTVIAPAREWRRGEMAINLNLVHVLLEKRAHYEKIRGMNARSHSNMIFFPRNLDHRRHYH